MKFVATFLSLLRALKGKGTEMKQCFVDNRAALQQQPSDLNVGIERNRGRLQRGTGKCRPVHTYTMIEQITHDLEVARVDRSIYRLYCGVYVHAGAMLDEHTHGS